MSTEETIPTTITPTVQTYYDSNIAAVKAIDGEIAQCNMPTEELMAWGEQIVFLLETDHSILTGRGLDPHFSESLPARLGTFLVAASEALLVKDRKGTFTREWQKAEPTLKLLEDEITEAILYACRGNEDALQSLKKIKEGQGHRDSIFDLLSLYKLGTEQAPALEKVFFDMSKLETAQSEHTRLLKLFTAAENSPAEIEEKQELKDRAFTWLMEAINEIDACARYTFGRNSEQYAKYQSDYWKRLRAKSKSSANSEL